MSNFNGSESQPFTKLQFCLRSFFYLLLISMLSSCSMDTPPKDADHETPKKEVADFFIQNWNSKSSIADSSQEYASDVIYRFEVCLAETSRKEILRNSPFTIFDGEQKFNVVADELGCVTWSKTLHFEFAAPALYIPYEITFSSPQLLRGQVKLPLALNPWVTARRLRLKSAIDLRKEKVDLLVPKDKVAKALAGNFSLPKNSKFNLSYHFRTLALKYGGVDVNDERSSSRTVKLLVTACITDTIYFTPARGKSFDVQVRLRDSQNYRTMAVRLNEGSENLLTTDHMGCLRFTDRLTHKRFQSERFYIKDYYITDKETQKTYKLSAAVNPWNTGWLFARDLREVNEQEINEISREKAELFFSTYSLQSRGTEYSIDEYLRLTLQRKYIIRFVPEVLRHDSLSHGRLGRQQLVDGYYLLKVALARDFNSDNMEAESYVNSWEQVVEVKAGVVVAPLHFELQDLTLMGSRARILIQLFTVNENLLLRKSSGQIDQLKTLRHPNLIDYDSGLVFKTFTGPLIPKFEGQGPSLIESPVSAQEYIQSGKIHLQKLETQFTADHELENYDKRFRLYNLNLTRERDIQWLTHGSELFNDDLDLAIEYMKSGTLDPQLRNHLGQRFCSLWFSKFLPEILGRDNSKNGKAMKSSFYNTKAKLHDFCQSSESNGRSFFSFENKIIVRKLAPQQVRYMGGSSFNYNVSSGFSLSKGEAWDVSSSKSSAESFSASLGGDALPFFSLKVGKTLSLTASESHGHHLGRGASLNYGAGAYLVIQHSVFRINLEDYERCLIVKPRWSMLNALIKNEVLQEPKDESWVQKIKSYFKPTDLEEQEYLSAIKQLYQNSLYLDVADSGLRICSGKAETTPISINEDYFYIAQHFTSGDLHDPADLRNRPWLMSIRSLRDFRVFIEAIHNHNMLSDVGHHNANRPIEILAQAYSEYNDRQPSWPRLYSFRPYDQRKIEDCQRQRSMVDDIVQEAKEIIAGTRTKMSGRDIDFWPIYYCGQE